MALSITKIKMSQPLPGKIDLSLFLFSFFLSLLILPLFRWGGMSHYVVQADCELMGSSEPYRFMPPNTQDKFIIKYFLALANLVPKA